MTSSKRLREKCMRHVAVPLRDETIAYMLAHMLPDGMRPSIGALAAKVIEDHVALHRKACALINTAPDRPGWPSRRQMMGGR